MTDMVNMYLRTLDKGQIQFPFFLRDLLAYFPDAPHPRSATPESLAKFGIYPVAVTNTQEADTDFASCVLGAPQQDKDGSWSVTWEMHDDIEDFMAIKLDALSYEVKARLEDGIAKSDGSADAELAAKLDQATAIINGRDATEQKIIAMRAISESLALPIAAKHNPYTPSGIQAQEAENRHRGMEQF